jgi:hypothetical protein
MAIIVFKKTGAGEGIRTLDPNLGKIRLYEILSLFQIVVWLLGNPNTIRTFSTQFAQSGFCAMFWRKPPHLTIPPLVIPVFRFPETCGR